MVGIAAVTLLYNWPTTLVLWLGQTDLMVLAALSLAAWGASRERAAATGLGLSAGALIKTWPVVTWVWLLRRGARDRKASLLWVAAGGVVGVTATTLAFGPDQLVAWFRSVTSASHQPDVVHYSAWGFGRQLFGSDLQHQGVAMVASVAFGLVVLGLLAITLWRPGDAGLSLWHVTIAIVLLLPISHAVYLLLGLPILWHWAALVLSAQRRDPLSLGVLAFLVAWWVVVFRVLWPGDLTSSIAPAHYAAIIVTTLAALGLSVFAEARHTGRILAM